ncbi:hypothetical protein FOXYS1_8834 [Fusarium oxysporum]|uniref:C2H2-type domain-containing protein n=1 Tax=Fusarium oxysporum TaxID=5507 RepID=A0A8H5A866_FUSOX|nr:hypothetical protein FOXYS1_8834 [Fusarium oxysporum]
MATTMDLDLNIPAIEDVLFKVYEFLKDTTTAANPQPNLKDRGQEVEDAANSCLDEQIKLLQLVDNHFKGVPWASLPLKIQNVLSTEITSFNYRVNIVKSGVTSLLQLHDSLSTPVKPRVQNAYKTPLSTEIDSFLPLEQTYSQSSADNGSISKSKTSSALSGTASFVPFGNDIPRLDVQDTPLVLEDTPQPRKTRASTRSQTSGTRPSNAPSSVPVDRERNLRKSQYSMASKRKVIQDSDDEFEDESRDAQIARQLQDEEYANATLPFSTSQTYGQPATRSTRATTKRSAVSSSSSRQPKKPCLDDDLSDLEYVYERSDNGNATDIVEEEAVPEQVAKGFKDAQGHIRIGPQPLKATRDIRTAPRDFAEARTKAILVHNYGSTDFHFNNGDKGRLERASIGIMSRFSLSYVEVSENWVKYLCDYTGLPLQWSGGPQSLSLESMYPVVIFEQFPAYHAPPNVCLIMQSLNWAKRRHPIITLPLVSAWLNACEEQDFMLRRSKISWVFNALSNTATMTRVFDLLETHNDQIKRWASYDQPKRKAILEVLRTGAVNSELQDAIRKLGHEKLWVVGELNAKSDRSGASIYRELCRIATQRYHLTKSEFEYYCTVPAPRKGDERVFYPFYALSQPQAKDIGWSWPMMIAFAKDLLKVMRLNCNRHAEQAGYGEKHVNAAKLIYWMGSFLFEKIKTLKVKRPDASREEIALMMLDRWGLPLVPWRSSIFRVSLCKKQDHGIAMVFGIADTPDFDPIRDIDLSLATVTLDSGFTNLAMWNFDASSWDSIQRIMKFIPLHHPLWQVTSTLGNDIWLGEWDQSIQPVAPTPEFETHLLSIEAWVDGKALDPFVCKYCGKILQSAGQLVDHCRKCPRRPQSDVSNTQPPNLDQDTVNEGYWDSRLHCDHEGCGYKSFRAQNLLNHKATHSEKSCKCGKCGKLFATKDYLREHEKTHDEDRLRSHTCKEEGCGKSFFHKVDLASHMVTHTGKKNFKCRVEGCGKSFGLAGNRNAHEALHSNDRPFLCETVIDDRKCGKAFKTKVELTRHVLTHSEEKLVKCNKCTLRFVSTARLNSHMREVHSDVRRFECGTCGERFKRKEHLQKHVERFSH